MQRSAVLSRRQWMQMACAGAGVLPVWRTGLPCAVTAAGGLALPTFPQGAIIRTVLNDIPPDALADGATLLHEHVSLDLAHVGRGPGSAGSSAVAAGRAALASSDHVTRVTALVKEARHRGASCIVDGGHLDGRRTMSALRTIAERARVSVVASGGFCLARAAANAMASSSDDQIADDLVREAVDERVGLYREIGTSPNAPALAADERRVFRALGTAHLRTGLPIATHHAYGAGPTRHRNAGLQQLDILESVGVSPEHVAIGHTCCLGQRGLDVAAMRAIARRGAFVACDRVVSVPPMRDDTVAATRIAVVLGLLDAGCADQLLLSADFIGQRPLDSGPGYGRMVAVLGAQLREAGVDDATLRLILQDNPRRFLAFVPGQA